MDKEQEILRRLSKIEAKLDKHLEKTVRNEQDTAWIKGYIKFSITAIISLTVGIVTALLKIFFN